MTTPKLKNQPPTPSQNPNQPPTQETQESQNLRQESSVSISNETNANGESQNLVMSSQTTKAPLKKPKSLPPLPKSEKDSGSEQENSNEIPVTIEEHKPAKKPGFFSSIIESAKDSIDDSGPAPAQEKRGRGRPPKAKDLAPIDMQQDFTNLLAGVLALSLAAVKMPPEISPDENELTGVSHYFVRILLRHFPLNNAMSADTLDMIGIFSILAAWYTRVQPYMAQVKAPKTQRSQAQPKAPAQTETDIPYSGDLGTELFLGRAIQNRSGANG